MLAPASEEREAEKPGSLMCSPELLANPIPELARKCFFHLLVAQGTSMRPPRQVVVYVCIEIFSSGIFPFSLDLHSTSQQLTAWFKLIER